MINGLQMIMFLPAINVDFPSNAFLVINKILLVATFDIPYFNMATVSKIFPLPVDDSILDAPDQSNLKSQLAVLGNSSQLSDIKNVIGGADYTVDDITASVITVDT